MQEEDECEREDILTEIDDLPPIGLELAFITVLPSENKTLNFISITDLVFVYVRFVYVTK